MAIITKWIILLITTMIFPIVSKPSPTPFVSIPSPTITSLPTPLSTPTNKPIETFESQEDPDIVTNYYKDLFNKNGSKVKSFITTKTNGNVFNKLTGTIDGRILTVEIKKDAGSTRTVTTLYWK
ncbi:MAG: hypothetical protein UR39_C0001G0041 [Candidatus Woesebacteria bacterium GW2011_GWA1_33_30]|uniref:Uncharacterized protein n=1 Tax=Candidatus Woesebacteria bacterium GW2011_GWA2_33_28 TaxID=1618561 RepID=A0A0G0AAD1_9BACT|nr:MAG: hypothetical protein UR38_C0001G0042 [Candidatus Woesebacteria bacterium GW2011_GWA2_33_28]KKP49008.1 MAG: hypothetical protein UR39_C0001G0041 [Candidatus Woesebacteria bacterium GW2011_GWA1_33_30]KKP49884.1 MAG: hypothetical protein UR40_C0003G0056 [Microgenomates group bacterium GW2011_GWC1_33_32]KKP52600.1 MAG: hypothetical protein UR44_C0001G0042 [Candidatus Woesebacteria bacterium GW2011_GWB1_33_38]